MSKRDRGDRGALVALGLILGALILVAFFGFIDAQFQRHYASEISQSGNGHRTDGDQTPVTDWPVASQSDFNPWLDGWAQWTMAALSIVATMVSFFALYWIGRTYKEARKANKIATKSAERQSRAYVHIAGIEVKPEGEHFRVWVDWQNTGQTPTRNLRWHLNLDVLMGEIPHDFEFTNSSDRNGFASLGPGQSTVDCSVELSAGEVSLAIDGLWNLYLWGSVEYDDVFKKHRRTEFCVRLDVEIIGGDWPNGTGKCDFTPHTQEHHNGADDECFHKPGQLS